MGHKDRDWMHVAGNDPSSSEYSAFRMVTYALVAMASGIAAVVWWPGLALFAAFSAFVSALWWHRWRRGGWGRYESGRDTAA